MPACNGLELVLSPPQSLPDIAHHLNALLSSQRLPYVCINCAVEESALCERRGQALLPQDALVASQATAADAIIACLGGNDVVLKPSISLIASLALLLSCASEASLAAGTAPGFSHFTDLFCTQYASYLHRLCANRPAVCVVCMVYYPQQALPGVHSWADASLGLLGYSRRPEALQRIMRAVFEQAVCRIPPPPGTRLVPLALYSVLDPTSPLDYVQRVEPSSAGGAKMAAAILAALALPQAALPVGAEAEEM